MMWSYVFPLDRLFKGRLEEDLWYKLNLERKKKY
jgi:hypothetical protein